MVITEDLYWKKKIKSMTIASSKSQKSKGHKFLDKNNKGQVFAKYFTYIQMIDTSFYHFY